MTKLYIVFVIIY